MDRQIIYPGQIPLETDLLNTNRNMMVALSGLAKAMFGSSTIVNGLACTPTSPASLQVAIGAGEIYSQANLDDTAYSSLVQDINHQIMKQGIALDAVNLSCPAPSTSGNSINYLIEAKFVEADAGLVTLPYYNASNPSTAYSGPANSGAAQPTKRAGTISLIAKPGTAASTGTQTTPAADAGYVGLWVVTVANGATSITSGNIAVLAGAPFVPTGGIVGSISATAYASRSEGAAGTATGKAVSPDVLAQSVQGGSFLYAAAAGTANALTVALAPAPAALQAGMQVVIKATATNTSAATLNVNALGAKAITAGGNPLLAGMLLSGQLYALIYDGTAFQMQAPTQGGVVAYSLGVNGYKVWSYGEIEQWGYYNTPLSSEGTALVTFNISFPTACFFIRGTILNPSNSTSGDTTIQESSLGLSNAVVYVQDQNSSFGDAGGGFKWQSKGN